MLYFAQHYIRLVLTIYKLYREEKVVSDRRMSRIVYLYGNIGIRLVYFLAKHNGLHPNTSKFILDTDINAYLKPHTLDETIDIYNKSFNKNIRKDYDINDIKLLSVGTTATIYKVFCRKLGAHVVLKCKHVTADKDVATFVKYISQTAKSLSTFLSIPPIHIHLFEEFVEVLKAKIDFVSEANNLRTMREKYICEEHIIIPDVIESNDKVIVTTYHQGVPLESIDDAILRHRIKLDMNMFVMTNTIIHGIYNSDAEWFVKLTYDNSNNLQIVAAENTDIYALPKLTYKIIVYNFSNLLTSHHHIFNRKLIASFLVGKYNRMIGELQIQPPPNQVSSDPIIGLDPGTPDTTTQDIDLSDCVRTWVHRGCKFDKYRARCINCVKMFNNSIHINLETMGTSETVDETNIQVLLHCYHDLLKRMGKYTQLKTYIEDALLENQDKVKLFYDWLYKTTGKFEERYLFEILAHAFGITE